MTIAISTAISVLALVVAIKGLSSTYDLSTGREVLRFFGSLIAIIIAALFATVVLYEVHLWPVH